MHIIMVYNLLRIINNGAVKGSKLLRFAVLGYFN